MPCARPRPPPPPGTAPTVGNGRPGPNADSMGGERGPPNWTNATSPIGVYVTQGGRTLDQLNARSCNFLIRSEPSTVKPRKLTAPNVAPGSHFLSLANFAEQDESVATQVISSSASCAPLSFASLSTQGPAPSVSRMIRR